MSATTEAVRKYEIMLLFKGDLGDAGAEHEFEDAKKMLQEHVDSIWHEEKWGSRRLAYTIKKFDRGYYFVFNFDAKPEALAPIRQNLRINTALLRFLITSVPPGYKTGTHQDVVIPFAVLHPGAGERTVRRVEERFAKSKLAKSPAEKQKQPEPAYEKTSKEQEEQLKDVEERLEKILENPDIDIK